MLNKNGFGSRKDLEQWTVDKIIRKRTRGGICEYLVKWRGDDDVEYKTWESVYSLRSLNLVNLVAEFEKGMKMTRLKKVRDNLPHWTSIDSMNGSVDRQREDCAPEIRNLPGFDQGLEPQKIVGTARKNGEIMFLVIWKDSDTSDFVRVRDARFICPELVIDYYERCISWAD